MLARLREERPTLGIPVIITASAWDTKDFAEFIQPPVVAYFLKPFALTALLESIRSAIAHKGRKELSNLNRASRYSSLSTG